MHVDVFKIQTSEHTELLTALSNFLHYGSLPVPVNFDQRFTLVRVMNILHILYQLILILSACSIQGNALLSQYLRAHIVPYSFEKLICLKC